MAQLIDTYIKRLKPQEKRLEKYEGGGFGMLIYPAGTKRAEMGNRLFRAILS